MTQELALGLALAMASAGTRNGRCSRTHRDINECVIKIGNVKSKSNRGKSPFQPRKRQSLLNKDRGADGLHMGDSPLSELTYSLCLANSTVIPWPHARPATAFCRKTSPCPKREPNFDAVKLASGDLFRMGMKI